MRQTFAADALLFSFSRINQACFFLSSVDVILARRAIQTSLIFIKRINRVVISRCEFPSRNQTSPLDCRAADHFSFPPPFLFLIFPLLHPARTICYISSPLLSNFDASGRPRHSDGAQQRERSEARQAAGTAKRRRGSSGGGKSSLSAFCWILAHWMLDLFLIGIWIETRDNFTWDKTRLLSRLPAISFARRVDDGSGVERRNRRLPEERNWQIRRHAYTRVSVHQLIGDRGEQSGV